jgi:hypothetical protein
MALNPPICRFIFPDNDFGISPALQMSQVHLEVTRQVPGRLSPKRWDAPQRDEWLQRHLTGCYNAWQDKAKYVRDEELL